MSVLKTQRLVLRPLRMDDRDALFAIYGNAQAMKHWTPRVTRPLRKLRP
ncbi:MAG: hypothetical protein ABJL67_05075 [Sulfitobacter sp.]